MHSKNFKLFFILIRKSCQNQEQLFFSFLTLGSNIILVFEIWSPVAQVPELPVSHLSNAEPAGVRDHAQLQTSPI